MNERINKLFEQALEEFKAENKYATIIVPNPLKEKFAQLIVKECTSVLFDEAERLLDLCSEEDNRKLADAYESGHYQCIDDIDMIKQHFGVEE
jgi:hypothetical protein